MLQAFRNFGSTIFARIFLIILALSFVAWGIGDYLSGGQQSEAIEVNGTSISVQQFAQRYEQQVRNISQSLGMQLTPEQAIELGLPQRVFNTLVQEELMRQLADDLDLAVPPARIRNAITNQTFFHDQNGFSEDIYTSRLRTMGMTPAVYERQQARQLLLEQLGLFFEVPPLPASITQQRTTDNQSTLDVTYVALTAENLTQSFRPTDADLQAFYQKHQQRYQAPAVRTATILPLTLEALKETVDVADAEVKAYYEENTDRYRFPPERQVEQIVFETEDAAQTAYNALQNDADFNTIAANSADTTPERELGWVVRNELPDAYAAAVFNATLNVATEPVESPFGWHIFQVTDTRAAGQLAFAEVEAEIREQLKGDKAFEKLYALQEQVEDQLASGATGQEVANSLNLPALTYNQPADKREVEDIPADVIQAIWQTPANGYDNVALDTDDIYYLYVSTVQPAQPQPLADVRARVAEDWRQAQIRDALAAQATQIQQAVPAATFREAVRQHAAQARLRSASNLTRTPADESARLNWLGTTTRDALYYRGTGATEVVPAGETMYVVHLTGVNQPDLNPDMLVQVEDTIRNTMRTNLINQFVRQAQMQADVEVNQAALDNLLRPQG